jgi:glycosyltransferase involved in cell wall biosynthesis
VAVIQVVVQDKCPEKPEAIFSEENGVRVLRIYRRGAGSSGQLSKLLSVWRYYRAGIKAVRSIRQFAPDVIHAHIMTRAAVIGWRASVELKAPLVISEHWSRYLPQNHTYTGWLRRMVTNHVVSSAAALAPVSEILKKALIDNGLSHPNMTVIPNVVDTGMFSFISGTKSNDKITFIHISCFDDRSKNISGFLRVLKAVSEKRHAFHCLMIGDGPDFYDMKEYAGFLRIPPEQITFTGLAEGNDLAGFIRNADFSVISSHYETFGTVIVESLACGTPVLSTMVGIAPEIITPENGMLTGSDDEQEMERSLVLMMGKCRNYDRLKISQAVQNRFNQAAVGQMLVKLYLDLLN